MNKKVDKIFPFLWVHGEPRERILSEIEKIKESGISSFCVESRPHPSFCKEGWWDDFGFILREAEKRRMTVWLLDDVHYPSGRANGKIEERRDLWQKNIIVTETDAIGPVNCAKFLLKTYGKEESLVSAAIFKVGKNNRLVFESGKDVTERVKDDILYIDVPKGHFRILATYTSHLTADYNFVDCLNPQSTQLMIDEIYQPHFEHFKEHFGKTFAGFFSDEPRFGNGTADESLMFVERKFRNLGIFNAAYPYKDSLFSELNENDKRLIFSLWYDFKNDECAGFRVRYMDFITEEYSKNFSGKIGEWCREKGVLYAGHIIEDEGAHTRTCCSAGHYFRAMNGLDFAGIDVVYRQLRKGYSNAVYSYYRYPHYLNSTFYNYTLPKLASSAARADKRKNGKALCEIFGAFGWGETITEMKWLVDFMISRGINNFIPHAFNCKENDEDSPPYFYEGGKNPSFTAFGTLMKYTSELCEIFTGGQTTVNVAVLYHADAEWSGLPFLAIDEVCKYLTERQINFDVIPEYDIEYADERGVHTKYADYAMLIVPYRKYFKPELKKKLEKCSDAWVMVNKSDLKKEQKFLEKLRRNVSYRLEKSDKNLRIYEYIKNGETRYFVFNEGLSAIENKLFTERFGYYEAKDFASGAEYSGSAEKGIPIELRSGQAVVLTVGNEARKTQKFSLRFIGEVNHELEYYISKYPFDEWQFYKKTEKLLDIADACEKPGFSGKIKISGKFYMEEGKNLYIDFGRSLFPVELTVNGKLVGERIGEPFLFGVGGYTMRGDNYFEVVLSPTLVLEKRDPISHFGVIGKYGFQSYPKLYVGEK